LIARDLREVSAQTGLLAVQSRIKRINIE